MVKLLWSILLVLLLHVSSTNSLLCCHEEERATLLHLKSALTYDNSSSLNSWILSTDCCSWDMVYCDRSCRVIEIFLYKEHLRGQLPTILNSSTLPMLSNFGLSGNNIGGIIPAWLFEFPSLTILSLYSNFFTGFNETINFPIISPLEEFNVRNNKLQGPIPKFIWEIKSLQTLDLEDNKFNDTILLTQLYKLQNLTSLDLWGNNISFFDDILDNTSNALAASQIEVLPKLTSLTLSSCNLGEFPSFLKYLSSIEFLGLASNRLHGKMPEWFLRVGSGTLRGLDLSNNSLTGRLNLLSWKSLINIDISSNMFQGPIPFLPSTRFQFLGSKNQFSGVISWSKCDLIILDLSFNNLSGTLPMCLAEANSLELLDLKHNRLEGPIPQILFKHCTSLLALSLSSNNFTGKIPKSLANCSKMKFLDLENNQLRDVFPHWLGTISYLKVLSLGSNNIYGPLHKNTSFSYLKIFDLSSNHLNGDLPIKFFMRLTAMVDPNGKNCDGEFGYMDFFSFYYESIYASIKGGRRHLERIVDTLVLIDFSDNQFQGQIPDVIGNLTALNSLNLSYNNFIGHIPSSLGNLQQLECLDMSYNHLGGRIPTELINLKFLEDFNVSKNKLVGPVPTGNQFSTFQDGSYKGNLDLCGPLLANKCEKSHDNQLMVPSTLEWEKDSPSSWIRWDNVLMGCGCGLVIGLVAGHYFFVKTTPFWLVRFIVWLENMIRRRP